MNWCEVNFDGLVGPTHNYAGLSYGNLASEKNRNRVSNPKRAAFQGLEKMRNLFDLGIPQAVLPPQMRPNVNFLRSCGFAGSDEQVILSAMQTDPVLIAAASSSAFMWTANAATVSPSPDAKDQRVHLTPANLTSGLHRSLEAAATGRVLEHLFQATGFEVHDVLPTAVALTDEGAANHMRLAPEHGSAGIEIFVYGTDAFDRSESKPQIFPARQTLQASQAIARLHQLDEKRTLFWKQSPLAIDSGAFHNDVVAVANENVLLCHELAFENQVEQVEKMCVLFRDCFGQRPVVILVEDSELSLAEAVKTYLFNSQLVSTTQNQMALIAPSECQQSPRAKKVIDRILAEDNPITQALFPDVRQSMDNGGGPACLRLRVVMNENQLAELHQPVLFSPNLESELKSWIEGHYREQLSVEELASPGLLHESKTALAALEGILKFPSGLLTGG